MVDRDAVLGQLRDELIQVFVQVRDNLRADGVRALAALTPIRERLEGFDASFNTTLGIGV